jgi:hypothetical protein
MLQKKSILLSMAVLLLAFMTGCNQVPDLTGMTKDQAQEALVKKKLLLGTVTTTNVAGKTAGTVVDQDPKPKGKIPDCRRMQLRPERSAARPGAWVEPQGGQRRTILIWCPFRTLRVRPPPMPAFSLYKMD